MTTYWCEYAWLPGGVAADVSIRVVGSRIESITSGSAQAGEIRRGLTVPGFANGHSHAFHRALRGTTHDGRGTFWTWREQMYRIADRLDPDSYYRLCRAVYAEMVLAGYTTVGEFHYLHHARSGQRYNDKNAMSSALIHGAADAGIRLTLLDACYLAGGIGRALDQRQLRFSDGDAQRWVERVDSLVIPSERILVGAAVHSVRAVPDTQLPVIAQWARDRPVHVHLSEQRAENEDCQYHYGRTPTRVLADAGVLGPRSVAVHATHVTDSDIALLSQRNCGVCICPTTERDLGDGIGPARDLADAGVRLSLGSDSHAVLDACAEAGALELNERLATETRGRFATNELMAAATDHGSLGWSNVGRLEVGAEADLVTIDLSSARTAGIEPEAIVFAARASDITDVVVSGNHIVRDRTHQSIPDVGRALAKEIESLWEH